MDLCVWCSTQPGCHSQSSTAVSLCDCPSARSLLTERLPQEPLPVLICSSGKDANCSLSTFLCIFGTGFSPLSSRLCTNTLREDLLWLKVIVFPSASPFCSVLDMECSVSPAGCLTYASYNRAPVYLKLDAFNLHFLH